MQVPRRADQEFQTRKPSPPRPWMLQRKMIGSQVRCRVGVGVREAVGVAVGVREGVAEAVGVSVGVLVSVGVDVLVGHLACL
jgi:hypothetical protein